MSIWDKFKAIFGGAPAAPAVSARMRSRVEAAALARARAGQSFIPLDVAGEVSRGSERPLEDIQEAVRALEVVFASGLIESAGFTRTFVPHPVGNWVYHPKGADPSGFVPASPLERMVEVPSQPAPAMPVGGQVVQGEDDYVNPKLLGFSDEELARRSTRIDPARTGWVGPTSAIPSAEDERIAAIDRGLVMRGLLTEAQIAEIHEAGAKWGRWRNDQWMANMLAARSAEEAVARLRQERADRRAARKKEAAEREAARAQGVAQRRAEDVIYLGAGVSSLLADRKANVEQLQAKGLPVLATPADVARALGITIPRLRWLAFHSEAAERTHYVYFEIPKRSGGTRLLSAPHEELAKAQKWILDHVLSKLPVEPPAHGFVPGRSTVTNAAPHLKRDLVVNLDLKDFFPSVIYPRVRGVFRRAGYSGAAATVLALLCTESPRRRVEYDGKPYWVAVGPRGLPQGACTSPALSNQVARKLDRRLSGMAKKHAWAYTRYADDLTFSAAKANEGDVAMLLARVRHVVGEEGFAIQEKKGRILRASGRQTVTGIVVNQKPSLPREELRRLRAILHNARKTGLAAQNRDKLPHFEAWLRGKIAYVSMVDRQKGLGLLKQLEALEKPGAAKA